LAYDETGSERQRLALQKEPQVEDLALRDILSGDLWVALKDTLRRYAADGTLLLHTPVQGIERLASDSHGNVWAATSHGLLLLNPQGQVLRDLPTFVQNKRVQALVADPRDLSVWAASKRTVWHVGTAGRTLLTITLPPSPPIRDLALSVGVIPPLLTFLAPAEGAVLTTRTPELLLRSTDTGQGVDPQTLRVQANAVPLPVTCTHQALQAQCVPTTPLPFGPVTLTATIADRLGNVSEPATLHVRINQAPIA
jgi:hypothetical protein